MSKIKENDFVEIEYTGMIKGEDIVFDTTDKETAGKYGLDDGKKEFAPAVVCVGEGHLLKGVEEYLIGKEVGEYEFDFEAEKGFGKKNAKLIQLIPTNKFKKQGINPMPGMQINVDESMGVIKTVTGGRTIVDFNHPLSGKPLAYKMKVNRIVEDLGEKVSAFLKMTLGLPNLPVKVDGEKAIIDMKSTPMQQAMPDEFVKMMEESISRVLPIKNLEFETAAPAEAPKAEAKKAEEPAAEKKEE